MATEPIRRPLVLSSNDAFTKMKAIYCEEIQKFKLGSKHRATLLSPTNWLDEQEHLELQRYIPSYGHPHSNSV